MSTPDTSSGAGKETLEEQRGVAAKNTEAPQMALACPFCGELPWLGPVNPEIEGNCVGYVVCSNDQCQARPCVSHDILINDERGTEAYQANAIARWNTRAVPSLEPCRLNTGDASGVPKNPSAPSPDSTSPAPQIEETLIEKAQQLCEHFNPGGIYEPGMEALWSRNEVVGRFREVLRLARALEEKDAQRESTRGDMAEQETTTEEQRDLELVSHVPDHKLRGELAILNGEMERAHRILDKHEGIEDGMTSLETLADRILALLEEKESSDRNALNLKMALEDIISNWKVNARSTGQEVYSLCASQLEQCLSSHAPESADATRVSIPKSSEGTNQ